MRLKNFWVAGFPLLLSITLSAHAQQLITQHTFTGSSDGAKPSQVIWTNGLIYGSTSDGGTTGSGTIFTFDPSSGAYTTIYSFTGEADNGSQPNNLLVTANAIYGTTSSGGTNNGYGMVFSTALDGTGLVQLYSFGPNPDGGDPVSGLTLGGATLYGMTSSGGSGVYWGTIFSINTNGTGYTTLHSFSGEPDGGLPRGELVLAGNTLYGVTYEGGANNAGCIFSINTGGTGYTVLHSFGPSPDANYPGAGLILNAGVLYGTGHGGSNYNGAIFAINTNGTGYKILYSFSSLAGSTNADGTTPQSTLTFSDGYLYGTASSGGLYGGGTMFMVNTNGSGFTTLASFVNSANSGWDPLAGAIRVGNNLWGTTSQGAAGTFGTLYHVPIPAIIAQPQSITVTNNTPASFTVSAVDDTSISYQWYFNTTTFLAGQTANTLSFANATSSNVGTYTVVLTDKFGSITSSPATLAVVVPSAAPVITSQPQNCTVMVGNTASFTNAASGTSPLGYQWYFNTNTLLAGQTSPILVIPSAAPSQAGYYTVVVTNLYGSATSSPAQLTVNIGVAPTITEQPQNESVTNGLTATFISAAGGTAPLSYQWYFNTNTPVSGGTSSTLTISPATSAQAGYYTVVASNPYGNATSTPALLTVVIPPSRPAISQQPQNISVTNGYSASFTNVATGAAPLSYQWYFNTNQPVAGGTNAILLIPFATTNQAGKYSVVVTNMGGNVTSTPASLTIISTKPIIFTQPQPTTVTNGNPATFTVIAAGQNPLRYQWYLNSTIPPDALRGQTNSTLSFANASNSLAGNYLVIITNSLGKATSSLAPLTIISAPVMTLQPQSVVVTNGYPVSFTSSATGAGVLSFQWFFHTNTLLTAATNNWLTFTNAITNLDGYYSVRVTNTFGAITSSFALLTVSSHPNFLSYTFTPANGGPSFAFANVARSTNRLWATTNLSSTAAWQVIASNVMATNGLWFYTDTNAVKTNNARFYRFSTP